VNACFLERVALRNERRGETLNDADSNKEGWVVQQARVNDRFSPGTRVSRLGDIGRRLVSCLKRPDFVLTAGHKS
jgi:hypothetical protein